MYNKNFVIPGLIIVAVVLLSPFWYNAMTQGLEVKRPVLEKAIVPIDPETGEKVAGPDDDFIGDEEKLAIWRARHMDFVSFYFEYEPKVKQCDICHKPTFCNDCHAYAGVKLNSVPSGSKGVVEEDVHHHLWMKDIIKREDIADRRCFACHRPTLCRQCHPIREIPVE